MSRRIDPRVDFAFKALLGSQSNVGLLIHFLNAALRPAPGEELVEVVLLNPFSDKEFPDDKLSVVDVRARDRSGCLYQIEIQLFGMRALVPRILYGFGDLLASQLSDGQNYQELRPVIALWILGGDLLVQSPAPQHIFCLHDREHSVTLDARFQIHILELSKWRGAPTDELGRWMWFFNHAGDLDPGEAPPDPLQTQEMRQAMETLKRISEKERDYIAYQARMNHLRWISTLEQDREEAFAERDAAFAQRDAAQREAEAAQREADRMKAELEELRRRLAATDA